MSSTLSDLRTILVRRRDQLHIVLEQTTTEMAAAADRKERSRLMIEATELLAQRAALATVLLDIDTMAAAASVAAQPVAA